MSESLGARSRERAPGAESGQTPAAPPRTAKSEGPRLSTPAPR